MFLKLNNNLGKFEKKFHHAQEKIKGIFVIIAFIAYFYSLYKLSIKINPLQELDAYLIKALANLSIPFGIILLQEFIELISTISQNAMRTAQLQFEIVVLVILRGFFKEFGYLNEAVYNGQSSGPIINAFVKIISIAAITILILIFIKLSNRAGMDIKNIIRKNLYQWKQLVVMILSLAIILYMAFIKHTAYPMTFVKLVFTGIIIVDGIFFLIAILKNHEFDTLMFDGALVVGLILARFPLFVSNNVSLLLAVTGVGFIVGALYLFVRPAELTFLGEPPEDEVSRFTLTFKNDTKDLAQVHKETTQFLKRFETNELKIKHVNLACEELLSNIIFYGFPDKKEHNINVELAIYKDKLAITISDAGIPFNPFKFIRPEITSSLEDREIGGLGIHLVRHVMDRISYRRETGRNVVTLLKDLKTEKVS